MTIRRCPQCGSASDNQYGFCIKCGFEFPKIEVNESTCPLCGYANPDEADYCVKCGTPLIFKNQSQGNPVKPIVIEKQVINRTPQQPVSGFNRWLIVFGYIFSILGGLLGLIIALYLVTRKDSTSRRHGYVQLAIFGFYVVVIAALYMTGNLPADIFSNYKDLVLGNMTLP